MHLMALEYGGMAPLFQVFDLPISLAFYQNILEFELLERTDDWAMLQHGDATLMLNTAYESHERPDEPDPARQALHQDTTLYFGCLDPDAAFRELAAKGLKLDPPKTAPYGMRQLYFHDPDGYLLCFQHPVSG
jgi:catechol 2,3-dioxygenase-like lactoylglutathione lyase family enzyme